MRLGIKPHVFLARLLVCFFLTYLLWIPVAPAYTHVLALVTRSFIHLTELGSGAPTVMEVRETSEGRPAIYYRNGRFAQLESGIPAEWVQANLVLLIPLMLATPAVSYRQRFTRLGVALAIALALQVLDITMTVKALYASFPPAGYGALSRRVYQFADAFSEALDTQLFPFAIWAGIHLKQLLGRAPRVPAPEPRKGRERKKGRKGAN